MVIVSIRADTSIGRKWDQYNKQNIDPTYEGMERMEAKNPINLTKGHGMLTFNGKNYLSIKLLWYCTTHPCIYHLCQLYMPPPPIWTPTL